MAKVTKAQAVDKIKLLMGLCGFARSEYYISKSNSYIRVGYWKPLYPLIVYYINAHSKHAVINEVSFHDDDCGELYSYDILYLQGVT